MTCPSAETRWPTLRRRSTSLPMATISPANSWPVIMGTGTFFWDHSSQFQMWMSVPQTAVRWTRISTSSSPATGMGASISSSPSAGFVLARAFIMSAMSFPQNAYLIPSRPVVRP